MPLGDSITSGHGSSPWSYRRDLWDDLGAAGYDIDFVGSQRGGRFGDPDHEGHPGFRIDQLDAPVAQWLTTYRPDLVLLHIGTNDMAQNYLPETAPIRLGLLIDKITGILPEAAILVASLIPAGDASIQRRIDAFNARIPEVVGTRAQRGDRVYYIDIASALTPSDLTDALHPNDTGFRKMADRWMRALTALLPPPRDRPAST